MVGLFCRYGLAANVDKSRTMMCQPIALRLGVSVEAHRLCIHGMEPSIDWNRLPVSQTEQHPQVYDVSLLRTTKRCPCPFPGCPGYSRTWNGLRLHFISQNWGGSIRILEEHPNPLPKCEFCGIQVP